MRYVSSKRPQGASLSQARGAFYALLIIALPAMNGCLQPSVPRSDGSSSDGSPGAGSKGSTESAPLAAVPPAIQASAGGSSAVYPTGGIPPYTYSLHGVGGTVQAGSTALGEIVAVYAASGSAATGTLQIQDSAGNAVSVAVTVASSQTLYAWGEDSNGGGLFRFTFDPATNAASALQSLSNSLGVPRGGWLLPDGGFLLGDAGNPQIQPVSSGFQNSPMITLQPGSSGLAGSHGVCALPNGHMIIGDDSAATANPVAEVDAGGNFIRLVDTSGMPYVAANHPGMVNCLPLGDRSILMTEADTWGNTTGELVEADLVNGAWTISQRLLLPDLDAIEGTSDTIAWSFILHTDGFVYFAPGGLGGSGIQKLVRCPLANLAASSCELVGSQTLPGSSWMYGTTQIPGSDDLLLATSSLLYRYSYSAGTYTQIGGFTGSGNAAIDASVYVRGILIQ